MSDAPEWTPWQKIGPAELMELVDLFNVSPEGQERIREILAAEPGPVTSPLFRYYNDDSRVERLEAAFAEYIGVEYALGVNSCTSALIASMVAAGVGPGAEVIVPAYTFFASASAIVVAKGIPVITEVDDTLTLDPAAVEANLTGRTRAIIAVHMMGHPAKMDALRAIADKHDLVLVEDVAQACGGSYRGRMLGSWGHLGCFSFDAYKTMSTAEGGMITTDNEWLYTRAQSYHDTAACWRPKRYAKERRVGELFCGENYRLNEMSGAIGLAQLRGLPEIVARTRRNYRQMRASTELPEGVTFCPVNDLDGVGGYRLPIQFATQEMCEVASNAGIGIGGMASGGIGGARDWHLYTYWEHILEQKTATAEGCPFHCPHVTELPDYGPDMCPRTKDILYRTAFFSIDPFMTPEYISWAAEKLGKDLARVVG